MSVAAAFSASMVSVTSVPDAALAGAVRVTVPWALPPLPAAMVMLLGEAPVKLRSLLARTVKVPVADSLITPLVVEATVKGMEMVEPGSMLVVLARA